MAGTKSKLGFFLIIITNTEKLIGIVKAIRFPNRVPEETESPIITVMPDIAKTIETKLTALKCYKSQIKGNSSRSLLSVKALAKFRGSQNGCEYAEAFKLIRAIV